MRVGFMGSPAYAVATLQALVHAGFVVPVVYTQPPRRKGRGQRFTPCPVHATADTLGIPVLHPVHFKNDSDIDTLKTWHLDILVVVAYGIILPQAVLDIPKYGCINGHASLLPRWRGAAPIQRAIEAGDSETGVCIMHMDAGLDSGDIISTHKVDIPPHMHSIELHHILSKVTAQAIVQDLKNMAQWQPTPQPTQGITYAHKLQKSESLIDWQQPATDIYNKIRALHGTLGTQTTIDSQVVKIIAAKISNTSHTPHTTPIGSVVSVNPLQIACGNGTTLDIQTLQKQGKKPVATEDFLNGTTVQVGDVWGNP